MESNGADFTNREAVESQLSDNGTVTLEWSNPDRRPLVLEQASREDFSDSVVRYTGTDTGSVISGLAEGSYHFRIGSGEPAEWSRPLTVTVEFFPRDRLVLLLCLGAVVVVSTIGAILGGWLQTRNGEETE